MNLSPKDLQLLVGCTIAGLTALMEDHLLSPVERQMAARLVEEFGACVRGPHDTDLENAGGEMIELGYRILRELKEQP